VVASRDAARSNRSLRWTWPVDGKLVSRFKASDPLRSGIKIAGEQGRKIRAAESGKVVYSGSGLIGYGRLIIVKHNDNYLSAYGHNRKILVAEGNQVTKGQTIAEMGAANDGQALLHFEIRRDGKPVDPLRRLPRR
jgi:lipoprotein NlpD